MLPSKFKTYKITNINENNCDDISQALSRAFDKYELELKMKLDFSCGLNPTMRKMMMDYMQNITGLGIKILGNEEFLLEPGVKFDLLNTLSVRATKSEFTNQKKIIETFILKHSDKLINLRIDGDIFGTDVFKDLSVASLPVLESLTLYAVHSEALLSLLRASKPTLTRLEIRNTKTDAPASDFYSIPNLQHLSLQFDRFSFNFVTFNASNLVSLTLIGFKVPIQLPELPKLKELKIYDGKLLPLLPKCQNSLEILVYEGDTCIDDYAVPMPKLTDLYMSGSGYTGSYCNAFLEHNLGNLEFLYLYGLEPVPQLDNGAVMEKIETVVLKSRYHAKYPEEDRERMGILCPNADINLLEKANSEEIKKIVKSRFKKKCFTVDDESFYYKFF